MKLAIGCDHAAKDLKIEIIKYLQEKGHKVTDYFEFGEEKVDYPDAAVAVAKHVVNGENDFGILICGTGVGISMSANKIDGVRAALCTNEYCARLARAHNDANILCMGARVTGSELAKSITDAFLSEDFEGGRHKMRVDKIMALE